MKLPLALVIILSLAAIAHADTITVPDVTLIDQNGKSVNIRELVKDRAVAMNFIFTSCTTVCPALGATFVQVQKLAKDPVLISISVDPVNDTPERLRAWSEKLGAKPGWTLLTGEKSDVDKALKSLGVFTADRRDHSPMVLVGKGDDWQLVNGYASASKIAELLADANDPTGHYFKGITLTDQDGRRVDLYKDLMRGHTVVINSFFADCHGSCPVMASTFAKLQKQIGERNDVTLISISVDPEHDTPPRLKEYAKQMGARAGWTFLTGSREEVDRALAKIGQPAKTREDHMNVFIVGNVRTGLWKKVFGLAKPEDVVEAVMGVINDRS
ncbi:MAG TPA: SCO family protein [Thermoanaerobaculia bacterium]|nr:SCO family protein [Thermoanaerobaculia bacterium]